MSAVNFTYQKIVMKSGECFTLPNNGELIYASDTTNLTSECDIPKTFDVKCYSIAWEDQDNPPQDDAAFVGVTIDGVYYPFTNQVNVAYNNSANDLQTQMTLDVPEGIFIAGGTCDIGGNEQFMFFQSVGTTIIFKIANPNGSTIGTFYIYLIADLFTDCACP